MSYEAVDIAGPDSAVMRYTSVVDAGVAEVNEQIESPDVFAFEINFVEIANLVFEPWRPLFEHGAVHHDVGAFAD